MRPKILIIYLIIFIFLIVLAGYFFLYNIYGTEVRKSPEFLFADSKSEMIIEVLPINALGTKAIFRNSSATFELIHGSELIEIIEVNESKGLIRLRSKGEIGLVGIKIKSKYSLLPEYIEFEILSLTA